MIRVLENLVHTEGNRDIVVESDEKGTYVWFRTGSVSNLEVGKTYTYSITFQGKKGGYGNIIVEGTSMPFEMVEHTGDAQTVHHTIVRTNNTVNGVYLVRRGDNNYSVGESVRLISISIHEGTQGSDVYTPPHTALTPEQVGLMKYGEFTEITSV